MNKVSFRHSSRKRRGIARTAAAVANRRTVNPENRTRPPLAHLKRLLKASDGSRAWRQASPFF